MAIGLFLVNIVPMVPALPDPTRPAFVAAALLLCRVRAWRHVRHRTGDRCAPAIDTCRDQLFGWSGLLISGAGYYLVPRFAGQLLRWPRLATVQLSALVVGVALAAVAFAWRAYGNGPAALVLFAQGMVCAGFLLLGVQIAGTFRQKSAGTAAALLLRPSR